MLIELDYETVSALESALIVAEDSKMRDTKDWGNIAESMGHQNRARRRGNWRRFAGNRPTATARPWTPYRRQKRRAPMPDGADTGAQCIKTMFILPQI